MTLTECLESLEDIRSSINDIVERLANGTLKLVDNTPKKRGRPRKTEAYKTVWLRPAEAAKFLGVARMTLYRWEKKDDTFPRKRQLSWNAVAYNKEELATWLANRCMGCADGRAD